MLGCLNIAFDRHKIQLLLQGKQNLYSANKSKPPIEISTFVLS